MQQEPIFSAVVGNACVLGFFDVFPDFSCEWQYGKTKITSTVNASTLDAYLKIAQKEGRKHIAGANVQEYYWNPRALQES